MTTFLGLFGQLLLAGILGSLLHFACNYGKSIHCNLLDYAKGEVAYTFASFGAITVAAIGLISSGSVNAESAESLTMGMSMMFGSGFMSDNVVNRAPDNKG